MIQMLEIIDKVFQAIIINMFKNWKKKQNHNELTDGESKQGNYEKEPN